jgi:hypothetical protein
MIELKSNNQQPTNNTKTLIYLENLGCKLDAFENHPYWNDVPQQAQRHQQQQERP